MREDEFREQLRGALGEPPRLRDPLLRPAAGGGARSYSGFMALLAAALAIVLVVVLVGTRVMLRPQGGVAPGPAIPSGADSFPCALAVIVVEQNSNSINYVEGFVNIPGGGFRVDPKATIDDLPHNPGDAPMAYSPAVNRWLPVVPERVSPDGTRYAYVTHGSSSSQLHVVDAATKTDRVAWTYAADIEVVSWLDSGIVATTVPFAGGIQDVWTVNPAGGAARAQGNPIEVPPWLWTGSGESMSVGADSQGRAVYRFGSRDRGSKYSVVMVQAGRVVATMYSGTQGDAKDFDPAGATFDAHGVWMGNFDSTRIWLWSSGSLRSFAVNGLPDASGAFESAGPAGPCVPGTFGGVAASPAPGPPSPSPTPNVDWSPLLARPLQLPAVASGSTCPVSDLQQIDGQFSGFGKTTTGPQSGYGRWPAWVAGQSAWYSDGGQGVLVLISSEYSGPVIVRAARLDGSGTAAISGLDADLGGGASGIAPGGTASVGRMAGGGVTFSTPGCYGFQLDGDSWTSVAVLEVKKGPPPPG